MSVNKRNLQIEWLQRRHKKKDAMKGLELFIDTLIDCMSEGEKVMIMGFGRFEMKTAKEKIGRNPQTEQQCIIPEHENIKFVASEGLADRIKERRRA